MLLVTEKSTVVVGKLLHYFLLLVIPWLVYGPAVALTGAVTYSISLSIVLALMFFVSHNVPENKPLAPGMSGADDATRAVLLNQLDSRDWGVQQILASANWGGVVGNFFTGGLNLQVSCLNPKARPAHHSANHSGL